MNDEREKRARAAVIQELHRGGRPHPHPRGRLVNGLTAAMLAFADAERARDGTLRREDVAAWLATCELRPTWEPGVALSLLAEQVRFGAIEANAARAKKAEDRKCTCADPPQAGCQRRYAQTECDEAARAKDGDR